MKETDYSVYRGLCVCISREGCFSLSRKEAAGEEKSFYRKFVKEAASLASPKKMKGGAFGHNFLFGRVENNKTTQESPFALKLGWESFGRPMRIFPLLRNFPGLGDIIPAWRMKKGDGSDDVVSKRKKRKAAISIILKGLKVRTTTYPIYEFVVVVVVE